MPINPLSGRSPRSLGHCSLRVADIDIGRALRPHKSFFWPSSGARTGGSRVSRTRSERAWLDGGSEQRVVGLAALWSDVTRRNSPLSTSSTYFRGPRAPVGRSQHKVPGENPRTTTSSSLDLGFKGRKRPLGRVAAGWRAGNTRAARCPISLLRPVVTRLYRRRRGRAGHKATHTSRTRLVAVHAQSKHDGLGDGRPNDGSRRRMRMASMMATSRQVRVWSRWG